MNLGMMKRRMNVGEKTPDIYEDCVTLEFTETFEDTPRPITANNNNVITYLDKLIIDGVEITPTKDYQHTFDIGNHKIGWKFKSTIIGRNVIAQVSPSSSPSTDLSLVTIPANITEIQQYAMRGFPAYAPRRGVTCYATTPPIVGSGGIALWYIDGKADEKYLRVPAGSVDAYKAAARWSDYASAIIAI